LERRALHGPAAERGAIAARERARVRLHDAHEIRGTAPGDPHLRDADGAIPVESGRFAEQRQSAANVHLDYLDYYTRDELSAALSGTPIALEKIDDRTPKEGDR
jgi:hypothetical protein